MSRRLSIIIPFCNAAKYLERALESVVALPFPDFECLCVDDGSTDGSSRIVARFAERDSRFVLLCQEHRNAGVARNLGLSRSCGEYVTFLDADDMMAPGNALAEAVRRMDEDALDCLICGAQVVDSRAENPRPFESSLRKRFLPRSRVFSPDEAGAGLFIIGGVAAWAKVYRRKMIETNGLGFADLPRSEDISFVQSALVLAKRISSFDKPLVLHRTGTDASLEATKDETPLVFWEADRIFREWIQERGLWPAFRAASGFATMGRISYNLTAMRSFDAFRRVLQIARSVYETAKEDAAGVDDPLYLAVKRHVESFLSAPSAEDYVYREFRRLRAEKAEAKEQRAPVRPQKMIVADESRIAALEAEIRALRSSESYRIGMALTWPLRKVLRRG